MTFLEFWNDNDATTLWLVTVGIPAGLTLTHDTDTEDDEAYFDLGAWVSENEWCHELTGSVSDGRWRWDGEGDPRYLTNSVLNLTVA